MNILHNLQQSLLAPYSSANTMRNDSRPSRLLSALLLILVVATLLRVIYAFIWGNPTIASLSTFFVSLLAYILSRTRYFTLAAVFPIIFLALPAYLNAFNGPDFTEETIRSHLTWLTLPIIFAGIFLTFRGLLLATSLILAGIICLPIFNPSITFTSIYGSLGLTGTAGALLLVMRVQLRQVEKLRQNKLIENQARYQALFERSNDSVFIVGLDGSHLAVNEQASSLLGYRVNELLTMPDPQIIATREEPDRQEKLKDLMKGQKIPLYERTFVHRDGHEIPVEVNVAVVYDEAGKPLYIQSIVRDISERKRIEKERERLISELGRKNLELERFTYTVSHDLKAPLLTIQGFINYLQKDLADNNSERTIRDIERINQASTKMEQLLDELLMLSRAGRLTNTLARVNLADIIQEALELTHGSLDQLILDIQIDTEWPYIFGDRLRMVQVLQNLLDNASKFMGDQKEPKIEIRMKSHDESEITFFVRDNGIGIDPKNFDNIFGLFNKLDSESGGSGIGLALCRRILEAHQGKIWVESEGFGQGSTFYVSIPVIGEADGKKAD